MIGPTMSALYYTRGSLGLAHSLCSQAIND